MKMHDEQADTSVSLAEKLVSSQFPEWAKLPIKAVNSTGTDHAIFRLGDSMSIRLPLIHWATEQAAIEEKWLHKIAPFLPLAIPEQIAQGKPDHGYPFSWSIYRWLEGENAIDASFADANQAAQSLAGFITALREIDTSGAPHASMHRSRRGLPLATRDADVRKAIADLEGKINIKEVTAAWEHALEVPDWKGEPVWFHGDLLPGNILVNHGKPSSVIDWNNLAIGDPACDLMIAWRLFNGESRETFRNALEVDDATWERGMGHALAQALIFIPYYFETNPIAVEASWHAVNEVLANS